MRKAKKKPSHGGKRPNAGRKSEYDEPTVVLYMRVPESKLDECKALVKSYLKK